MGRVPPGLPPCRQFLGLRPPGPSWLASMPLATNPNLSRARAVGLTFCHAPPPRQSPGPQVASFNRQQKAEDACAYCFNSSRRPRHMAIAIGQSTYLALVSKGRLSEGHCYIAPAEHVASMRQVGAGAGLRVWAATCWGWAKGVGSHQAGQARRLAWRAVPLKAQLLHPTYRARALQGAGGRLQRSQTTSKARRAHTFAPCRPTPATPTRPL
jgi:hypothetical protein